jgi:hypothetical protein
MSLQCFNILPPLLDRLRNRQQEFIDEAYVTTHAGDELWQLVFRTTVYQLQSL